MLLQEAFDPYQCLFELVVGGAVGAAHVSCASSTECAAGNNGHLLLEKQLLSKFFVGHARVANVRKGVEGSSRLATWQPDAVEAIDKHAAAASIVIVHHLHVLFAVA